MFVLISSIFDYFQLILFMISHLYLENTLQTIVLPYKIYEPKTITTFRLLNSGRARKEDLNYGLIVRCKLKM